MPSRVATRLARIAEMQVASLEESSSSESSDSDHSGEDGNSSALERCQEALKAEQLRMQQQQEAIDSLREQVAAFSFKTGAARRQWSRSHTPAEIPGNSLIATISTATLSSASNIVSSTAPNLDNYSPDTLIQLARKYGTQFGIFGEFVEPPMELFGESRPPPFETPDDRYKDAHSMNQGIISDLYDAIPSDLHKYILGRSGRATLVKEFVSALNTNRSNIIHRLRKEGPALFSTLPVDVSLLLEAFKVKYDRSKVPEFQALLKSPSAKKYPIFAPILFPDGIVVNQKYVFRNPLLPQILRVMIWGPSALHAKPSNVKRNNVFRDLRHVNASAISSTAVLARVIVSPDREFNHVGSVTQIDWTGEFRAYKRYLLKGFDTVPYLGPSLYTFWDQLVFGTSPLAEGAHQHGLVSEGVEDEIERALREACEDSDSKSDAEAGGDTAEKSPDFLGNNAEVAIASTPIVNDNQVAQGTGARGTKEKRKARGKKGEEATAAVPVNVAPMGTEPDPGTLVEQGVPARSRRASKRR